MIVELLAGIVFGTLAFVIGLLPSDSVPWPDASAIGPWIGGLVGPLDAMLPVAETITVLVITVTIVLPALLVYRVAMWMWTLLPIPGSG